MNDDKKPTEPLLSQKQQIASSWKNMDDNFETKSKSGVSSQRSSRSRTSSQGGYSSKRIKQREAFKKHEIEYQKNICNLVKGAKFAQLVFCPIATYCLTWWALLIFPSLFFVLHSFTEQDLMKEGWRKFVKFYIFVILCIVQIVYIALFLMENFVAMLFINIVQIIIVLAVKSKIDLYKSFLGQHSPDKNVHTNSEQAKQFFNPALLQRMGRVESNCDKKQCEAIVKKYESKYKGKDMPYEIGKQILKEVNEHNNRNQLTDLNGQIFKHARYIVEEQINKMEKQKNQNAFNAGISDNGSDDQNDAVYIFLCGDLKKEIYTFVSGKLKRECSLIDDKGMLVVRIKE